jgi:hypothetical protein
VGVIEVSVTIDSHDIERAVWRAGIVRDLNIRTVPVVAGRMFDQHDIERARDQGVAVLIGGSFRPWPFADKA